MFTLVEYWEVADRRSPRRLLSIAAPVSRSSLASCGLEGRWAAAAFAVVAHLGFLLVLLSLAPPVRMPAPADALGTATFEARMINEGEAQRDDAAIPRSQTSNKTADPVEAIPLPQASQRQVEWTRSIVASLVEVPSNSSAVAAQQQSPRPPAPIPRAANAGGYDPYASAAMPSSGSPTVQPARLPECPCGGDGAQPALGGCTRAELPCPTIN